MESDIQTTCDVLAIAAHPDDVELRAGGLMLRLADLGHVTGILDLTRGEMGTRGTPEERAEEAREAARILGAGFRDNAGLPDGRLMADEAARVAVARFVRRRRPRIVLAPWWSDSHPDHGVTGRLAHEASFVAGLRRYPGLEGEPWRPHAILYWPSHYDFRPSFVVDVSAQHDRKLEAIRAFRSQLHDPDRDEPLTNIASKQFLERIEMLSRLYGESIGVEHGEPYLVRQAVPVDDPVTLFSGSDREWNGMFGLIGG